MRIRNEENFWSGVMFVAIGAGFAAAAQRHSFGTLQALGPGWFPTVVGGSMVALGSALAVRAVGKSASRARISRIGWRGVIAVLGALILFSVALPYLGIVVSLALLVSGSTLGAHNVRFRDGAAATILLTVLGALIFVVALGVQVQVWPVFFGS